MRKRLYIFGGLLSVLLIVGALSISLLRVNAAKASPVSCTATGFYRDNINLTAAVIAVGTNFNVTGSVNASGCNIGVYYGSGTSGTVTAEVFGANYFGVVNNGGTVQVINSRIHDIGENPLNGDQHGVAIYWAYNSAAKGTIRGNLIWNYQKGGIVVNGVGSKATVTKNTVIGQGPVNYIAQNGIQFGYGSKGSVTGNIVTGNSYTGANLAASGGIIVVGGSCYAGALTIGVKISGNVAIGNDIGIWLSNLDGASCVPTLTPTNIVVNKNISTNDAINNTTGYSASAGYQAGVADQGDNDQITNNSICGLGYTPTTPPPYLYFIDVTATNSPTVSGNTSCLDGSAITPSFSVTRHVVSSHAKPSFVH